MDLQKYIKKNNEEKSEEKLLLNNDCIKIKKKDKKLIFIIKKKDCINKYNKLLFMAPTYSRLINDKKDIEKFFEESLNENVEGIMLKNLFSEYKSGSRVGSMLKLKAANENLDLVILAAKYGKGKRSGFYSSFLMGVKDDKTNKFLEIGFVSSGIKELESENKDEVTLKKITKLLEPYIIKKDKDIVYFEPKIVLEIAYQDLQVSKKYSSGFALRFPRIKFLRLDKDVNEINTISDIKRLNF